MVLRSNWLGLTLALVLLAACAPLTPTKPDAPKVSESQLREKAWQNLTLGLRQYEAGSFDDAMKSLTASLDHGVLPKTEQAAARKHLAFIHCAANRDQQCRDEFRKAMEIDSTFDLTTAEAGHPVWGPVYRNVRAQMVASTLPAAKSKAPLGKAEQILADGLQKYEAGEYESALKLLDAASKEESLAKADRTKALKHIAFSLCLTGKTIPCRNEFQKIFEMDAQFELTPAEAGHPSWAKTYATAKQRAKDARDKAAKDAAKDAAKKK